LLESEKATAFFTKHFGQPGALPKMVGMQPHLQALFFAI